MADLVVFGLVCTLLALTFGLLWHKFVYKPYSYFKSQGIGGPTPLPLVGNLIFFTKFKGNAVAAFDFLIKTYGPVNGLYLGKLVSMCVADLDVLKEVLIKQFDKFAERNTTPGITSVKVNGQLFPGLFSSREESWRRRRHALTPAFSGRKMKLMEPLIEESVIRLSRKVSASVQKGESIDLLDLYRKMTLEMILSTAFGRAIDVQMSDGGELYKAAAGLFYALDPENQTATARITRLLFRVLPECLTSFDILRKVVGVTQPLEVLSTSVLELIKLRQSQSAENKRIDLLQLMMEELDGDTKGSLSVGEIVADCVEFLLAGYETTSSTLAFACHLLAAHPDVQEKLANELQDYFDTNEDKSMYDSTHDIEYLDMIVSETLRMYPPLPLTFRSCSEECQIKNFKINKGVVVFVPIYYIHHNPEVWPDPEVFNPDRFSPEEKANRHPCAYLPFGIGPRNCVGMRLALVEAKMALIEIIRNFRIELAPETKLPPEVKFSPMLRPKDPETLMATFTPRQ